MFSETQNPLRASPSKRKTYSIQIPLHCLASAALLSAGASHAADGQAKTTSAATTVEQSVMAPEDQRYGEGDACGTRTAWQKLRQARPVPTWTMILQDNGFSHFRHQLLSRRTTLNTRSVNGQPQLRSADGLQRWPQPWSTRSRSNPLRRADTTNACSRTPTNQARRCPVADPKGSVQ